MPQVTTEEAWQLTVEKLRSLERSSVRILQKTGLAEQFVLTGQVAVLFIARIAVCSMATKRAAAAVLWLIPASSRWIRVVSLPTPVPPVVPGTEELFIILS